MLSFRTLRHFESFGDRPRIGRIHPRAPRTRGAGHKPRLEILENRTLLSAWVATDKPDYAPGEMVLITGGEFGTVEPAKLQVQHIDGKANDGAAYQPWQVTTDATGGFQTAWVVPDDAAGSTFQLTATGLTSQLTATTTFTDDALTLYQDSADSIKRDAFAWNTTVFARNTGLSNNYYEERWYDPSHA